MSDTERFQPPPRSSNTDGSTRRVGIEIEMAGLRPEQVAEAVTDSIGGSVEVDSAFLTRIRGTEFGDFHVELDADLLKSRQYQKLLAELGIDIGEGDEREHIESLISRVAGLVVPLELVGPPVPWTELETLDGIRERLHRAGARGTQFSPLYAFGMQLNIEAASLRADYLLSIIRAFLLSYDELIEAERVDLSRRITPYVQPFPEEYLAHVLQPDYSPELEELIDDYLYLTPTRNRPLDLLPLFAFLDEARVMNAPVETHLIKARPAFHYRLPNCLIDQPDWSLATAWNRWVKVERLADDSERLERKRVQRLSSSSSLRRWLSQAWRKLRR
ncbi:MULTISPECIES: amidoligase family protein [unclassified Wenzhouxiangella]|uniref:amidoligase family protein n=1 Tax=unclassified Wenzhouxiangella TaxID=2613841 RepID=UPI000E326606|nr:MULTISPECIES: amidoligase family protein [unclassified Wenzhouxiangella]RFF27185.1 amidoligase enzyme [Wenzhouxiangella sp. 15181]RFP69128.1 amidoligase enzyme [Wenzhouxiangella sp. 15190]